MQVINHRTVLNIPNFSNNVSEKSKNHTQFQNNSTNANFELSGRPASYISFGGASRFLAKRLDDIQESVIRSTTREAEKCGAINLGQGTPAGLTPQEMMKALREAIELPESNKYPNTWGIKGFRNAIAERYSKILGREINPEKEITVTCGDTEGVFDTVMSVVNPGEKVIMFEPFYDNYSPNVRLAGGIPQYVKLQPKDGSWNFDLKELEKAFEQKPKAIIINSPQNPSGKVFSKEEMEAIAELCKKHDVLAISDEIYENVIYAGKKHISIAAIPGMADRTVVVSGLSKSYNATGWRVGYVIAPPEITEGIKTTHDFVTLAVSGAYQKAGEVAMRLPDSYYEALKEEYSQKRDFMMKTLTECGFEPYKPEGSYFIMAGIKPLCEKLGLKDDIEFKKFLMHDIGVAVIEGSNFFADKETGKQFVRVSFCQDKKTLEAAAERLKKISDFTNKKQA